MAARLSRLEIEELLGAYALDAVDPGEAEAIEVHLRGCLRCVAEVASHREVAASMAYVGAAAPEDVWARIAANLEEPAPELDLARLTSLAGRRRLLPFGPVAAIAASAAVVIAALGLQVVRQDQRIDRLPDIIEKRGLDEAVAAAFFDAGARRAQLRSDDGRLIARAVVQANGNGYLVPENLPPLGRDRTYQLWALVRDRPVSVGVLGADPGVAAFKADADVSMLAITAETAGGVVVSDELPLVRGFVPRN